MGKRALIVATVVKKHIMQFHIPAIAMLKEMGYEVDVASHNDYEDRDEPDIPYADRFFEIPIERSPFKTNNIRAYRELKKIIEEGNYDVVHCHTPMGGFLTRWAARKAGKKGTKVFYTAHGFHFFKGAPLLNWILYYPAEKFCSRYTDVLFTINEEDYALAKKKFRAGHTELIHGVGLDIERFRNAPDAGKSEDIKTVITVGELNRGKNQELIIRALALLNNENIRLIIAGEGENGEHLRKLVSDLNLTGNVDLPGYVKDTPGLYKKGDLYIQASFREGLPVAVMEAMASGLPVLASDVRGSRELIEKEMLFDPGNVKELAGLMEKYIFRDNKEEIGRNLRKVENYSREKVLSSLRSAYERYV